MGVTTVFVDPVEDDPGRAQERHQPVGILCSSRTIASQAFKVSR